MSTPRGFGLARYARRQTGDLDTFASVTGVALPLREEYGDAVESVLTYHEGRSKRKAYLALPLKGRVLPGLREMAGSLGFGSTPEGGGKKPKTRGVQKYMKKAMAILGAALLLAGCDQNKGSSGETYDTGRGSSGTRGSMTNSSSTWSSSTNTGASSVSTNSPVTPTVP